MTPTTFPNQNGTLSGGSATSCFTEDISDLPVHRDGMQIISCWRPLFIERLRLLFTGRVWLLVLATRTHPPVHLTAASPFAEPRRHIPPWLPLALVAIAFAIAALCLGDDDHDTWIDHCASRGSTTATCERLWRDGRRNP